MKQLLGLLVILLLAVAACSGPAEDVARATQGPTGAAVVEDSLPVNEGPEPVQEEPVEEQDDDRVDSEPKGLAEPVVKKPIDFSKSSFEFEGFAPGKSHVGTFTEMEGFLTYRGNELVAAEGVINAASVASDSKGLDNHLKNEDFFDVTKFPEIKMRSTKIVTNGDKATVTGDLTFLGVSQSLTFPAVVTEGGLSAELVLDTTPFAFKYLGVNKEVEIKFNLRT